MENEKLPEILLKEFMIPKIYIKNWFCSIHKITLLYTYIYIIK